MPMEVRVHPWSWSGCPSRFAYQSLHPTHGGEAPRRADDDHHRTAGERTGGAWSDQPREEPRREVAERRHAEQTEGMDRQDASAMAGARRLLKQRAAGVEEQRVEDAPSEDDQHESPQRGLEVQTDEAQ